MHASNRSCCKGVHKADFLVLILSWAFHFWWWISVGREGCLLVPGHPASSELK